MPSAGNRTPSLAHSRRILTAGPTAPGRPLSTRASAAEGARPGAAPSWRCSAPAVPRSGGRRGSTPSQWTPRPHAFTADAAAPRLPAPSIISSRWRLPHPAEGTCAAYVERSTPARVLYSPPGPGAARCTGRLWNGCAAAKTGACGLVDALRSRRCPACPLAPAGPVEHYWERGWARLGRANGAVHLLGGAFCSRRCGGRCPPLSTHDCPPGGFETHSELH